MLEGLTRDRQQ